MVLPDHIDALYRAACAICGSRHDAEDLVQETFVRVLKRPRFVRLKGHWAPVDARNSWLE
jgi:DNA-directed RNA polymerase specialized sigma24 family protein